MTRIFVHLISERLNQIQFSSPFTDRTVVFFSPHNQLRGSELFSHAIGHAEQIFLRQTEFEPAI
jgi:hypothetical protein